MSKLTIPSEDAQRLWAGEDLSSLIHITKEFIDEWRWGVVYQLVIQDKLTEKYYSTIVKERADVYYSSLESQDEIIFDEVERVPVTTYEYRKPFDVER